MSRPNEAERKLTLDLLATMESLADSSTSVTKMLATIPGFSKAQIKVIAGSIMTAVEGETQVHSVAALALVLAAYLTPVRETLQKRLDE